MYVLRPFPGRFPSICMPLEAQSVQRISGIMGLICGDRVAQGTAWKISLQGETIRGELQPGQSLAIAVSTDCHARLGVESALQSRREWH